MNEITILSNLLDRYGETADEYAYLSIFSKNMKTYYENESSTYNRLFIGIAERILWLLKN
jgi:hypothetical protein